MSEARQSQHGQWSSRLGFILAASGAAVGLGNIWKFPYIAGENGGGAFVLMYLICIAIIGVPLMMTEVMMGRRGRQNPAWTIRALSLDDGRSANWRYVGYLTILAGFLILSYYSVIAGWALDYVYQAAAGHFTGKTPGEIDLLFTQLVSNPWKLLLFHTLIMGGTIAVITFGVEKGIERAVTYLFPSMVILLLVIALYSVKTGYFGHGVSFLFHPDFSALSAKAVLIALGHAFFTLSLATGSIMMYGAYLPKDLSIPQSTLFIVIADTFIALLAGLAIFPIVFANGLEPGAGPGLIFKTLPLAFGKMDYGRGIATLFFVMLVFAAFTSAISLLEPTTAFLIEKMHMTRKKATAFAGTIIWFLGIGTVLSFNKWADIKFMGMNFFDFLDHLTANIMLPLGGFFIAIFAAWL